MYSKNTSSSPFPPHLESTNMNSDRLVQWLHGYNTTAKIYTHSAVDSNSSSSIGINNFGSHAPGILKSMQILEAQFGHLHTSTSSINININDDVIINNNNNNNNNMKMMTMNTSIASSHPDLHVGLSAQSQELPSQAINICVVDVRDVNENDMRKKKKKKKSNEITDDGRIHSLPHKKNGPYSCSKCNKIFETSQKFANHVSSSHYKFESEEERKKRYISRIRKRSGLQIKKLNDGTTTFVPVIACANKSHASVNDDDHNMIALAQLPSGVKVKLETENN